MRLAWFGCVVVACGPAPAPDVPKSQPAALPMVEGVVLTAEPKQLIVDGDRLYWIGGGDKPGIFAAPIAPGARAQRLFEVEDASRLAALEDRLVWAVETKLFFGLKSGGEATKLAELPGAPWSMLDAGPGRLLVATSRYFGAVGSTVVGPAGSRVFEVSAGGEVTEQLQLTGKVPKLARAVAGGAIYVATGTEDGDSAVLARIEGTRVVEILRAAVSDLAFDGDAIYALGRARDHDVVFRIDPVAKTVKEIAEGRGFVSGLAVDDRYVYWGEDKPGEAGRLVRMPKAGGDPVWIAETGEVSALQVVGPYLYWSDSKMNRIMRLRR